MWPTKTFKFSKKAIVNCRCDLQAVFSECLLVELLAERHINTQSAALVHRVIGATVVEKVYSKVMFVSYTGQSKTIECVQRSLCCSIALSK